jgi:alkanesulfonate monooxygenase SsuD/methylene tetrahydromethanopterin reductase-like flavin-dependent oxidoreductase (luciferase family)
VTFRHPSELAKVALTVDHVSGGRVELGLGAGWNEREHAAFGFPFPETKARMSLLEEQLEVIRAVWTEDRAAFDGTHYRLQDASALPRPVQRPHPPIILGGEAGPRAAALAARFADEYNTVSATPEQCRERRGRLDAACERIGRDPVTLHFSVMATCIVGDDDEDLVERVRHTFEFLGLERDPRAYVRERGDAHFLGTIDAVAARIRSLAEVGVERVFLQHLLHEDLETVARLGSELVPALA